MPVIVHQHSKVQNFGALNEDLNKEWESVKTKIYTS